MIIGMFIIIGIYLILTLTMAIAGKPRWIVNLINCIYWAVIGFWYIFWGACLGEIIFVIAGAVFTLLCILWLLIQVFGDHIG